MFILGGSCIKLLAVLVISLVSFELVKASLSERRDHPKARNFFYRPPTVLRHSGTEESCFPATLRPTDRGKRMRQDFVGFGIETGSCCLDLPGLKFLILETGVLNVLFLRRGSDYDLVPVNPC